MEVTMAGPMAKVLKQLDAMDGKIDSRYTNQWLYDVAKPAGICKYTEDVMAKLPAKVRSRVRTGIKLRNGQTIFVNCTAVINKLRRILSIAKKLPTFKPTIALMSSRGVKQAATQLKKYNRASDLYGPFIVDQMFALVLGSLTIYAKPFHTIFGSIDPSVHAKYSQIVRLYGKVLHTKPKFQSFKITSNAGAYKLFKGLGKRYSFKTTDFKPRPTKTKTPRSRP